MSPQEMVLALASDAAAPDADERFPLDRVRVQKAIFLLTMRGPEEWRDVYKYRAYDWGPYSGALQRNVAQLVDAGVLTVEDAHGSRYGRYTTTTVGETRAEQVWDKLSDTSQSFIRRTRAYVTSRSFADLLREVYAAYPDYATESRFTG